MFALVLGVAPTPARADDTAAPADAALEVPTTSAVDPPIDPISGLVVADGYETVNAICTGCHSAKLVTQNRATREGWLALIRWMQRTQKLPALGAPVEAEILDYLAAHYAPELPRWRRPPLAAALLPPPAPAVAP